MTAEASPIRAGTRFRTLGTEFEITYVEAETVRFATVAGGITHTRKTVDLQESIRLGDAEITLQFLSRTRLTPRSHALRSSKELTEASRRLAYLNPVFAEYGWIWPVKEVEAKLKEIADLRSELPPHYATVARWRDNAKQSWKLSHNAPDYYLRGNGSRYSPEAWECIDELLTTHWLVDTRPSIADAWELAVGEMASNPTLLALFPNRKPPSLRSIQRRVGTYDPIRVCLAREGPHAARRMAKAAGMSMEADALLDVVLADGQLLDVLIIPTDAEDRPWAATGLRPYITILLDWKTRYPISMLVTFAPYSTCTVLEALRNGVVRDGEEPKGLMRRLLVDNGSDYISDGLKYAAAELGFEVEWAGPKQPDTKAPVERFIKTLTRYIHSLPGTVFSSPTDRGDYESEKLACITMQQLLEYIEQFKQIYVKRPNCGTGRAPLRLWQELAAKNPPITFEPNEVEHATRVPQPRQVTDGRVRVDNLFWFSHALKTWEIQCKHHGEEAWVDVLISETNLKDVIVRTREAGINATPTESKRPRPAFRPQLFRADSTKPRYTNGLSLYEHTLTQQHLKQKGIEDLDSLEEYELEKARYQMKLTLEVAARQSRRKLRKLAKLQDLKRLDGNKTDTPPADSGCAGAVPPAGTTPVTPPVSAPPSDGTSRPPSATAADDRDSVASSKIANIFGGARKPIPTVPNSRAKSG